MIERLPLADLQAMAFERRLVARVEWPDSDVAEGAGVRDVLAAAIYVSAGVPVLDAAGHLEAQKGMSAIRYSPIERPVRAYMDGVLSEDRDGRFITDLGRSSVVFEWPDGRLKEFSWSADERVVVHDLTVAKLVQPRLVKPDPEVLVGNPDQWLCELICEHWALDHDWHTVVASGLALTKARSDGRPWWEFTVESSWPHAWVMQTSPEQRDAIVESAITAVTMLGEDLDDLDVDFDPGDGDWRAALVEWCRRRDDLEGVILLLDFVRHGSALHDLLDPFDRAAAEFVRSIPVVFDVDDQQLRRAARFNPEAWWTLRAE